MKPTATPRFVNYSRRQSVNFSEPDTMIHSSDEETLVQSTEELSITDRDSDEPFFESEAHIRNTPRGRAEVVEPVMNRQSQAAEFCFVPSNPAIGPLPPRRYGDPLGYVPPRKPVATNISSNEASPAARSGRGSFSPSSYLPRPDRTPGSPRLCRGRRSPRPSASLRSDGSNSSNTSEFSTTSTSPATSPTRQSARRVAVDASAHFRPSRRAQVEDHSDADDDDDDYNESRPPDYTRRNPTITFETLIPAPLNLSRPPSGSTSPPKLNAKRPIGVDKNKNKPLPPLPPERVQARVRDQDMRRNANNIFEAVPSPRVLGQVPPSPRPSFMAEEVMTRMPGTDADREWEQQYFSASEATKSYNASQKRIAMAKRAVDRGVWNLYGQHATMEILERDERRVVNSYIAEKNQQRQREKTEKRERKKREGKWHVPDASEHVYPTDELRLRRQHTVSTDKIKPRARWEKFKNECAPM